MKTHRLFVIENYVHSYFVTLNDNINGQYYNVLIVKRTRYYTYDKLVKCEISDRSALVLTHLCVLVSEKLFSEVLVLTDGQYRTGNCSHRDACHAEATR